MARKALETLEYILVVSFSFLFTFHLFIYLFIYFWHRLDYLFVLCQTARLFNNGLPVTQDKMRPRTR